jgi:peptidoglycan/LPS O-acetylase OafA/YrhL
VTATSGVDVGAAGAEAPRPLSGRRVANVDVLRAFAALAVLAVHAYAMGGRAVPIKAVHWYDVPLINLSTGVWLFFGISGYVICRPFVDRLVTGRPLPDTVGYARRRALRIFPLYWIALTVLIAIEGAGGSRPWQLAVHYLLVNNLVPGREQALFPAAWTLTLEVLFYISVPLLAAAVRRRWPTLSAERLALLVALSWLASIAFTVVADLQGDGQIGLWLRGLLPAMWQMFCPGILLAVIPHLTDERWRRWLVRWPTTGAAWGVAVLALICGALLGAAAPLRFGVVAYQLLVDASHPLFAVGYGLVIAAAIRARPWTGRGDWLLSLGLASYGIYLVHPVIEAFLIRHGLVPARSDTLVAFVLHTAFLAALTVPVAFASWRWLEQPALRLARARHAPRA